ncbi:hypothetical protein ACH5RR_036594 [Cinchona calisaya]|uniref:Transmembrane 9 superfamily member n=1 Tax=Cinchona calisaya TaxID=153742 RepID=A0ABD2Y5F9_9GENT
MAGFLEIIVVSVILLSVSSTKSNASEHRYQKGDSVPLYANKVSPFHNPSETYAYYSLPFCRPDPLIEKKGTLGEVLNGDRLVSAPYKLDFLIEREYQVLCRKNLTREEATQFRTAISQDYFWEMYYDDLPLWGFIGEVYHARKANTEEHKYFMYTNIIFEIFYCEDYVIEIKARIDTSRLAELTKDREVDVEFSFTAVWKEINVSFEKRMNKYMQSARLKRHYRVHQFSIANALVAVFLLIGCLVKIYVRVLRKDFYKYIDEEQLDDNLEETGWKVLHGDVFRYPKHKSLLAAAIGSGTQLFVMVVGILMFGFIGVFHPYDRGVLKVALVMMYVITYGISGFTAVSFYRQLEGIHWMRNLLLTGCLFCGPFALTFCFINAVAATYGTTTALPLGTIVMIFLIWMLLACPLLLFGAKSGKAINLEFQAPCHTTKCPREIPALRWYRGVLPQVAFAGSLPFNVIYIELSYIFATIWGHRVYTLYGTLCIVFILTIIITALVSIIMTYIQLAAEDHRWWWRSFVCGGSSALYVYGYCFYYYFQTSDMRGFMQTSFFFGYMACISYGLFLMLGSVGFCASLFFVRYIYGSIKCE